MITHREVLETITRTRLALRKMKDCGGEWVKVAKVFDDNMEEIDKFIEIGIKDYQDLKQALAVERAINRELNIQIGQLTCHKTFKK